MQSLLNSKRDKNLNQIKDHEKKKEKDILDACAGLFLAHVQKDDSLTFI